MIYMMQLRLQFSWLIATNIKSTMGDDLLAQRMLRPEYYERTGK